MRRSGFHRCPIEVMFVAALLFLAVAPRPVATQQPAPRTAMEAARQLLDAFNRHDAAAMAALVTSDFELSYMNDAGQFSVATQGPAQLAAEMTRYFADRPTVRSTIAGAIDGPVFVSFREQIVGGQSSLAIYEVRDGLIRRAWYYPAEDRAIPESVQAAAQRISTAGMVVSGSPWATWAGSSILESGGNAIDAAVATAFALAVTEHSQTGLGGRTQGLVRTADGEVFGIDGTTQVPASYDADSAPRGETGYATIGIPGTVAALSRLLERGGTLSLAKVIEPARRLAEDGFVMPDGEAGRIRGIAGEIDSASAFGKVYDSQGRVAAAGDHFVQPDLARTLATLATQGAESFRTGDIARRMIADIEANGGYVTAADVADYRALDARVSRGSYRDLEIIGTHIPASGTTVIEIMRVLERFDLATLDDAGRAVIVAQALRFGFEDREIALDWEPARAMGWLLSDSLADRRAVELREGLPPVLRSSYIGDSGDVPAVGIATDRPTVDTAAAPGDAATGAKAEPAFTTHLTVADTFGNVVSMTQSLGPSFGSRVMTTGLGFTYASTMGYLAGERPGYRPFSSQAPLIVLRDGRPVIALGGGGARRIISALVWTLIHYADAGMDLPAALQVSRIHPTDTGIQIERGWSQAGALRRLGYEIEERDADWFARLNGIEIRDNGVFVGVGEPRWPDSSARGPGG